MNIKSPHNPQQDSFAKYHSNFLHTNARNNLYQLINMALEDSEVVNVSTKNGNAVILSEADYNSLLETLYLSTDPQYKQSLIDGKNTSISDCVSESDVKW